MIETKFNIGEKVYFISNARVQNGYIHSINISLRETAYCIVKQEDLVERNIDFLSEGEDYLSLREDDVYSTYDEAKKSQINFINTMKESEIERVNKKYETLMKNIMEGMTNETN